MRPALEYVRICTHLLVSYEVSATCSFLQNQLLKRFPVVESCHSKGVRSASNLHRALKGADGRGNRLQYKQQWLRGRVFAGGGAARGARARGRVPGGARRRRRVRGRRVARRRRHRPHQSCARALRRGRGRETTRWSHLTIVIGNKTCINVLLNKLTFLALHKFRGHVDRW